MQRRKARRWPRRVALLQGVPARAKGLRGDLRLRGRAGERAETLERGGDVLELARLGAEHRKAELSQSIDRPHAACVGPGDDEIRLQREHRLEAG